MTPGLSACMWENFDQTVLQALDTNVTPIAQYIPTNEKLENWLYWPCVFLESNWVFSTLQFTLGCLFICINRSREERTRPSTTGCRRGFDCRVTPPVWNSIIRGDGGQIGGDCRKKIVVAKNRRNQITIACIERRACSALIWLFDGNAYYTIEVG